MQKFYFLYSQSQSLNTTMKVVLKQEVKLTLLSMLTLKINVVGKGNKAATINVGMRHGLHHTTKTAKIKDMLLGACGHYGSVQPK